MSKRKRNYGPNDKTPLELYRDRQAAAEAARRANLTPEEYVAYEEDCQRQAAAELAAILVNWKR